MESYWSRFSSLVSASASTSSTSNPSKSNPKPRLGLFNAPSTASPSGSSSPVSSTLSNLLATARSRTRSRTSSENGAGNFRAGGDPLAAFTKDWKSIKSNLQNPDQSALHHGISRTDIPLRLTSLLDCLVLEENGETANALAAQAADPSHAGGTGMGSCMEYVLRERVLHHLVVLSLPDRPSGILPEVIKFFSSLIVLLDSSFLARQAVHKPLVRLLRGCVGDEAGSEEFDQESLDSEQDPEDVRGNFSKIGTKEALIYEPDLVDLMCHIAGRVRADPGLLLIFFQPQLSFSKTLNRPQRLDIERPLSPTISDTGSVDTLQPTKSSASTSLEPSALEPHAGIQDQFEPDAFPLFAYLLRFAHREGRVGDLARAGLGFVMDVAFGFGSASTTSEEAEELGSLSARASLSAYILHSDFSDVLGAGLGAVYGLLPTKLAILRPSTEAQITTEDPDSAAAAASGASMLGGGMSLGAGGGTASSSSGLESEGTDELKRLEDLGIEPSTSKALKEQIDLLVGMLDFAQTIAKKARIASFQPEEDVSLPSDSTYEISRFKTEAADNVKDLLAKMATSVKNLFLQNVLYPSLLECSNLDGSAVAVMSYLDVLLDVLRGEGEGEGEGALAEVVLRYLAGWDEPETEEYLENAINFGGIISLDASEHSEDLLDSRGSIKKKRRKSAALLSLEDSQGTKAKSRGNGTPYFSEALGRYTIQDLISDHLKLTSDESNASSTINQACAAAALRLARTLILRHGGFTTKALMKVQAKENATAFPWPISPMASQVGESLEVDEQRATATEKEGDGKEGSDDEFVYAGITSEKQANPWSTVPSAGHFKMPGSSASTSQPQHATRLHAARSSISLEQHLSELDVFFSLINSIDPSRAKSPGLDLSDSVPLVTTTGYENYLLDAEEALSGESTYKEGTRILEEGMNNAALNLTSSRPGGGGRNLVRKRSSSSSLGRSSTLNGSSSRGLTKSSSDRSLSSSIISHKKLQRLRQDPFRSQLSHHSLSSSDPFLRALLMAFSHFFEHSPELNIALTGTLSSLALCPYRSLEGWLVFEKRTSITHEPAEQENDLGEKKDYHSDHSYEDDAIDEKLRNASLWSAGQRRKKRKSQSSPLSGSPVPIILSLLKSLSEQVQKYRSEIENFDSYLAERRRGLMFVENLNDALGLDSIAGEDEEGMNKNLKDGAGPSLCVPEISDLKIEEYWKELGIQIEEDEKRDEEEESRVIYRPLPTPSTLTPSSILADTTQASSSSSKTSDDQLSATTTPNPISKREGFARFFGRPSKSTEKDQDKEKEKEEVLTTSSNPAIVTPFAQHYSQTARIIVKPRLASLPKGDWTISIDPTPPTETAPIDIELSGTRRESEDEIKPQKRTRFLEESLSTSSGGGGKNRKSQDGFTYPGDESDEDEDGEDPKSEEKARREYNGPTVTLSSVLDNVVILEESIKELVAIVQTRRNLGIDAVNFV